MVELGKAAERYQVEWIAIGELESAPYNPREPMNEDELERLGNSIRQHGFVEPIVADKRKWEKGRKRPIVVGGHQRLEACKRMELSEVPVVFSDCASLKDEQALNVRLNRLVGRWDAEKLVPILESFEAAEWPTLGFEEWEVAEFKELAILNGEPPKEEEASAVDVALAEAAKKKAITEKGDLWMLGEHRLLCGDSYEETDRLRVLDGKTPDLLHADPPYGIEIVSVKGTVGGSKAFGSSSVHNTQNWGATSGVARKSSTQFGTVQSGPKSKNQIIQSTIYPVIEGDDRPFDPMPFLDIAPTTILWGANYFAQSVPHSANWICWDKRENQTRNNFADCELAWCSKDAPARIFYHLWSGLYKGSQHGERRTHPTEKPVALYAEVSNYYAPKGLWFDPFLGSGAHIIAAQQMEARICALEIEPLYCDVAVRRWEIYTGQKAKRYGTDEKEKAGLPPLSG